ncbi:MAG TPA: hypothetical protein VMZ52_09400 [Bryobacteraceae bacterium]|nr:hypothetical protein [Bryobacteraceae bacterium]
MTLAVQALLLAMSVATDAPVQRSPAAKQADDLQRAVEEFRTQTRDLGIRPESVGTHQHRPPAAWHGRLFENLRNDFLDAVPHEIRQRGGSKSLLRRNQFGFSVGGPILIPRLVSGRNSFFSLSYEGVRERISRTYLRTIPIVPERTGDFSRTVDPAGNPLPIYDPNTTRLNAAYDPALPVSPANPQYLREPFPGNVIPRSRLDPVASAAIELYPLPNTDVGPFSLNNYFINSPETNIANGVIGRMDHRWNGRHRFSSEFAFSNGLLGAARWFPTIANPGPSDRKFRSRRASLEHLFTVSPQSVNTASFEASSDASTSGNEGGAFPVYQLQSYLGMGRSYPFARNARNHFAWSDGFSTRRGKHSLRLAGDYVSRQVNTFWPQFPAGSYSFSPGLTSLPGIVNTGHPFASFLLGLPEYAQFTASAGPSYFRQSHAGIRLRDQYEPHKGLTIALALNLTRNTPRIEKYDRQSTIDLRVPNPANGRPGALVLAGRNGASRGFKPVTWNCDPSVSIGWNPAGDAKTVVRLAYSRAHSQIPIYLGQWGTQAFNASPTFLSPNVQLQPALILAKGVPPLATHLPDPHPAAANETVADLIDQSRLEPLTQAASISLEREFPGSMMVSVGATYSGGRNLLVSNAAANPNAISPDALHYRDLLNDEAFNSSLRPYPQFKGFELNSSYPAGRYFRDAGFVRIEKRASKGLAISAYYEYSKQLDDYSGPYGKQDYFNSRNEWSLSAWNQPQRLQLNYVYELPVGANKPFLDYSDWRRYLVDGWSLSGTAVLTSGNPLALHPLFNNTGGVISGLRVDVVPGVNPEAPARGPSQWFNPAAFDQPADFTLGDGPRTHPQLRNPGNQNYDLSLNKRLAVDAERAVEFNAAAFNFTNHADWNDPDTGIGPASARNANAGKIIGSRGGRVIQLGMRFTF